MSSADAFKLLQVDHVGGPWRCRRDRLSVRTPFHGRRDFRPYSASEGDARLQKNNLPITSVADVLRALGQTDPLCRACHSPILVGCHMNGRTVSRGREFCYDACKDAGAAGTGRLTYFIIYTI